MIQFFQIDSGRFFRRMPQTLTNNMNRGTVHLGYRGPLMAGRVKSQREFQTNDPGNLSQGVTNPMVGTSITSVRIPFCRKQREDVFSRYILVSFQDTTDLLVYTYPHQLIGLVTPVTDFTRENMPLF